ncbi:hypothetical protein LSH36_239g03014 [Paralvinella palmiformis]|uniref:Uncharacterized protein n=1 Tax=Paralvinella palmiformis TaxID=53620 RepID=A0AAD9JML5_9ANNE|nr:hypothetical protein LSH36_239g03014 [Paralvinella palmiformis]
MPDDVRRLASMKCQREIWCFCSKGQVFDSEGRHVVCFPDVIDILELLQMEGYVMAIASRYSWPEEELALLELFQLEDYFSYVEVYIGDKAEHFRNLRRKSGIHYEDMLFFDDSYVNIRMVSELGVVCVYVRQGMTLDLLREGLEKFARLYPLPSSKEKTTNAVIRIQHILKSYKVYTTYTKLK